ncbi:MAG: primosomal protein N' [Chloroflexota bacterium]|nr:MAG: primosomal protein N' [Chloroflexota bacterium]
MPKYLEVAVNVPQVMGVYHYHLPPELEGVCQAGHLVEVPFGKQTVQGVVTRYVNEPAVASTRPVTGLIDPNLVLTGNQIKLAFQISEATLSPLASCIDLMLPPGLSQQADLVFTSLLDERQSLPNQADLTPVQVRLVRLLQKRGPLRGRQIDKVIPHQNWRAETRLLVKRGLVSTHSMLPPPSVRPKSVRTVQLACTPEDAQASLPGLGRLGTAALEHRQGIIEFLMRDPGPVEVTWVYAESKGSLADLQFLAERGLVTLAESEAWRDPLEDLAFIPSEAPILTAGQETVWIEIQAGLRACAAGEETPPFLLHGVTGSGKTEIYMHAVEETLALKKQAIVLVPEIALTPQTVRRFVSRFPGRVGLFHSKLSPGERYDTWRRARAGQISVVVGPRSALFTPFPDLGLIVIDECHDDSYYQSESPPQYNALDAAMAYARLAGAVCVMGSATPGIIQRYHSETPVISISGPGQGKAVTPYCYLRLPARILAHQQVVQAQAERLGITPAFQPFTEKAETIQLPPVKVIDMRQELKAGNRSIFSRLLQASLAEVLSQNQQAILFLNRRGTATYVFCRDCGFTLKCPHCDIPLTFHTSYPDAGGKPRLVSDLICHYCNYQRRLPKECPECRSSRIRQYGTGTERVEAEVKELFPLVRTLRWDFETTRQKGAHEIILNHFANHHADVLVGTQMLAKGLDLPLVTLVGVVLADVGLNLPDYRASERTFQLLTQVAGRAGRSILGGQVILQTFQPDHYVIQAAAGHDYEAFYKRELQYRRQLGYPPFSHMVRLEYRHSDFDQAEAAAQKLAAQIRLWLAAEERHATEMIGPAPCFFGRIGGIHRWQIVLRGPNPASLLFGKILVDWRVEVDPVSLL